MPEKLSATEIDRRLRDHPEWSLADGKLHRRLAFDDFVAAFGFMTRVALVAESMQHHPDWSNVYDTVVLDLSTHDVGGVSEKDFALAAAVDRLAG